MLDQAETWHVFKSECVTSKNLGSVLHLINNNNKTYNAHISTLLGVQGALTKKKIVVHLHTCTSVIKLVKAFSSSRQGEKTMNKFPF